jgi:flavin reductase (DIM6/NTAB) family NADH-FMN oxidoreductase RutF
MCADLCAVAVHQLIPFPFNKVGNVKARHETHRSVSALGVRAHPSIAVTPHARLTTLFNGIGMRPFTPMTTLPPEFYHLDPNTLSPTENYKLLIGSIVPRPIAFVSTLDAAGIYNLAPFSFFNGVCSNPPTVMFSVVRRGSDNQKKDTLVNIEATGQFVVNVVTEAIVTPMNACATEWPPHIDEFAQVGLTPVPSVKVTPPRVLEAPIAMECQLNQIVTVGSGLDPGNGFIVIGTVVQFHLRHDVYDGRYIDVHALKPVARLAGASYSRVTDTFELPRPPMPNRDRAE